jgi:hypothetical protein
MWNSRKSKWIKQTFMQAVRKQLLFVILNSMQKQKVMQ